MNLKIIKGWILITASYFITLLLVSNIIALLDLTFKYFQLLVGGFLVFVPYVVAGFYVRKNFKNRNLSAFFVSAIPMLMERIIIFMIGSYYVSERFLPGWNLYTVLIFIQETTPAFYFTLLYVSFGLISVLTTYWIAKTGKKQ